MRIEELKKAKDQRPFQPVLIRMADGREIEVRHPDAIAWDDLPEDEEAGESEDEDEGEAREPRTAVYVPPGGGWVVIELALITSLSSRPASTRRKPKGKAK